MEARAPNELALIDYRNGMKYREIAEKYGVSINTVKSWKTRYGWSKDDKKGVHTKSKKVCTQKGGQPRNKNAVGNKGGAAPLGNKNAVVTGEFETLLFDCFDLEEKKLAISAPSDKVQLIMQEIRLLTVRERRMLKRIEDLKQAGAEPSQEDGDEPSPHGITVVKLKSGIEKGKKTVLTEREGILEQIQRIEEALTRVQGRKQAAIDSLHRYGIDDARLELEAMRLEMASMKLGVQVTEMADDGFLEAMNGEVSQLWENEKDDG